MGFLMGASGDFDGGELVHVLSQGHAYSSGDWNADDNQYRCELCFQLEDDHGQEVHREEDRCAEVHGQEEGSDREGSRRPKGQPWAADPAKAAPTQPGYARRDEELTAKTLSDLGDMKLAASTMASNQARNLGLAGLGIVWLFAGPFFTGSGDRPDAVLFWAGAALAAALAFDLAQLVARTVVLEVVYPDAAPKRTTRTTIRLSRTTGRSIGSPACCST